MEQCLLPHQVSAEPSPSSGLLNSIDQTVAQSYPTARSVICRRKTNEEKERRSKKGRKNRNFACIFSSFVGDGGCHRRQGREEEKRLSQIPLFPISSLRQRVNPYATSGGGTWRRRSATVPVVQKAFPVILDCFGAIL